MSVSARERIHAMLPILDNPVDADTREAQLDRHLDAYRAGILAEAKVETVNWLVKKASEYRATSGRWHALQADFIGTLASKLDRGAVRAFIGTAHYRDAIDALADAETDQHGYRARVMRGAANDVRRLNTGEAS